MNKEINIPAKNIDWAKHVRNCDIGKQKFSKLRRRCAKLMILKNK
jgi:hypothetical protein